MRVKVLEFDPLYKLQVPWAISRPGQSSQKIADITFDAQILEFCHVVLEMEVPIIIRDLVFGYRDHIAWARGTRVQDPADGIRGWGLLPPAEYGYIQNVMRNERESGVPQDTYRQHVPLDAYTTFATKLSIRRLAKIYRYCSTSESEMIKEFGDELAMSIYTATEHDIWLGSLSEKVAYESPWPTIAEDESYDVGPVAVSYMLFAQILRHRNLEVHSYMDVLFNQEPPVLLTQGDPVDIAIKGSKHFIRDIVAKRNCWIAQGDLWAPILDAMNDTDDIHLPCDGAVCPFAADNLSRSRGEDPNPPCPIFMKQTDDYRRESEVAGYIETRGRDHEFWEIKVQELQD